MGNSPGHVYVTLVFDGHYKLAILKEEILSNPYPEHLFFNWSYSVLEKMAVFSTPVFNKFEKDKLSKNL